MAIVVQKRRILITGASGGLGSALARYYAVPGTSLSLWGRNEHALTLVSRECEALGAETSVKSMDLQDIEKSISVLQQEDGEQPFDIAFFCAGRGDVRAADALVEDAHQVAQIISINLTVPAALATNLADAMARRGRGKIVLIGSAAAFHALPFATAYSGSKAGLARFADALRLSVKHRGVQVTLISPGFIDTAAGRQVPGPKPMIMAPDVVAERIARAVQDGKTHLVLPWPFILLRWFDRALPARIRDKILNALTPPG